jgi:hypothetical protein
MIPILLAQAMHMRLAKSTAASYAYTCRGSYHYMEMASKARLKSFLSGAEDPLSAHYELDHE